MSPTFLSIPIFVLIRLCELDEADHSSEVVVKSLSLFVFMIGSVVKMAEMYFNGQLIDSQLEII